MSEESQRVQCGECGERNLSTSEVCWQCGKPLTPAQNELTADSQPTEPVAESPETPATPEVSPTQPLPVPPSDNSQTLMIIGFVSAGLGLCCCLFPLASIVLGIILSGRKNKMGTWVIVAGAVALLVSTMMSVIYFLTIRGMGHAGMMGPNYHPFGY